MACRDCGASSLYALPASSPEWGALFARVLNWMADRGLSFGPTGSPPPNVAPAEAKHSGNYSYTPNSSGQPLMVRSLEGAPWGPLKTGLRNLEARIRVPVVLPQAKLYMKARMLPHASTSA